MKRNWKRAAICAAIALASVVITISLGGIRFFQLLSLKAQDAHFVLRGKVPTKDIVLIEMDEKANDKFPEPMIFWQPYYAEAIQAAADAGGKDLNPHLYRGSGGTTRSPRRRARRRSW